MWELFRSPRTQRNEIDQFGKIMKTWQDAILLRWYLSEWCNYSCPYCSQDHSRGRANDDGFSVHCFDNYPPRDWADAIDRAFHDKELALTLSGGEAMLDVKNMHEFLSIILQKKNVSNIRIDTNLSWNLESYSNLPHKEKVIFMCTFHPSQTQCDTFSTKSNKTLELRLHNWDC